VCFVVFYKLIVIVLGRGIYRYLESLLKEEKKEKGREKASIYPKQTRSQKNIK